MKAILLICLSLISQLAMAAATQWADFTMQNGHVFLPVTVEGIETQVMLDSGAQIHGINKAFINKNELDLSHGSKVNIKGVHSTERRTSYNNVTINFFGTEFKLDKVVESNLGHHSNGLLLGAGFFKPFIIQINYPTSQLRLITRDTVNMNEVANVTSMPDEGHGMPIAELKINGKPFWFLVDTGNSGKILMERRYASQAGLLDHVEGSQTMFGANGMGVVEFANANSVDIGPFNISDVKVSFPAEGEKTNIVSQYSRTGSRIKGRKIVGILGYDLLKHFIVTLDYDDGKLHVALPAGS